MFRARGARVAYRALLATGSRVVVRRQLNTIPGRPRQFARTGVLVGSLVVGLTLCSCSRSPALQCEAPVAAPDTVLALTNEEKLLEESEQEWQELYNEVPHERNIFFRAYRSVAITFRIWIFEPIATGLRFVHLIFIFAPVVLSIPMIFFGSRDAKRDNERAGCLLWYNFLVYQMESAGPTFIKLGQWAASRTDIFPDEMCDMMSKLHSNVTAHSLRKTKRIISKAFGGRAFEDIFEEFDETPLGVGAIAQVYKAKLKSDLIPGRTKQGAKKSKRSLTPLVVQTMPQIVPSTSVAIKVLHPRVEKTVHRDLRIMMFFAKILNAIPTLEWFSFPDEVAQFDEMMRLQLDLRIEANNLCKFQENFKSRSLVTFPLPYVEYTTRQVLIEEYAHGLPLSQFLEKGGIYNDDLADTGLDAFLHMLILDNFVHADLHPGNIMVRFFMPAKRPFLEQMKEIFGMIKPETIHDDNVTDDIVARLHPYKHQKTEWLREIQKIEEEGYRPQLIFIDTGLVTELNEVNRKNFLDLFSAVANFDGHRAGNLMVERCRQPSAVLDPEIFALKMQHLVLGVKSQTFALGKIKIGDVLNTVLSMVREHHVRMEGDFVNVVLSILLLEGIGRQLNPNMDLFKSAIPFLRSAGSQGANSSSSIEDKSTWLKVWIGLELREVFFTSTSKSEMERMTNSGLFSLNV